MASEDARKLFVAGLPDSATEEVLRDLFSEAVGQVTELTLPRDRMSGRPRGFAFVRLASTDDAERARQVLDGRIVDGKPISVRPFQAEVPARREGGVGVGADGAAQGNRPPRREFGNGNGASGGASSDSTLYVGNLPYDVTQEEVESVLVANGVEPVLRVHLPIDQDGRRRGFGFVTVGSADVAKNALDALKNADLRGRRLVVNVAHPKGSSPPPRDNGGDRPPRPFEGNGGAARFNNSAPPSFNNAPRFGGAPPGPPPSFGGPPPPFGDPSGKNDGRRRKRFEGASTEGEGGAGRRGRHENDGRWRDDDDE